jgi:hypothetical protein
MKHASRANIVLIGFLAIGGFYLIAEHRAHLWLALPWLPWLLLAACPLMHLFMHHGHGGNGEDRGDTADGHSSSRDQR